MKYAVLAFYYLGPLDNPCDEVDRWKVALSKMGAHGRIYISNEGINAQMSLLNDDLPAFETWLREHDQYKDVHVKVHAWDTHAFEKLIIKFRKQLVAFDYPVNIEQSCGHTRPEQWSKMIEENDPNTLILDVRNQYEYDIGHFEGAIAPTCNSFREYREYTDKLCAERDPKNTRVLMYCTGGIRCEFFSVYLKEKGFDNLHQLDGGVIQYGLDEGQKHWKGKLFVFDDRMSIPISEELSEPIAQCIHCHVLCDELYNCANTDCNEMFVSCPSCIEKLQGCCSHNCTHSSRLRPLKDQNPHRPFRKWHLYANQMASHE